MTNDPFVASEPKTLSVSVGRPKSKTWAVRHLSKFFVRPYLQTITTEADRAAGNQRLRVICRHKTTNKAIGVVEVSGPADALPKAALLAACERIGVKATLSADGVTFSKIEKASE